MNKIAIVVGHDKNEQGAFSNLLKQSEYAYHCEVVKHLPFDIFYRPTSGNYYQKMVELSKEINGKGYKAVIELHFNSFNGVANGCEALFFNGLVVGKRYSEVFCSEVVKEYGITNRGAKAISKQNERGYWFLRLMDAPAIILEPFFGDNKEALLFKDHKKYADLIEKVFC